MEYYIKAFIAIILALAITFAEKIELFDNRYVFVFMTIILIYCIMFMPNEDPGLLLLYVSLYLVVWSIKLINKHNSKEKIKKDVHKDLDIKS